MRPPVPAVLKDFQAMEDERMQHTVPIPGLDEIPEPDKTLSDEEDASVGSREEEESTYSGFEQDDGEAYRAFVYDPSPGGMATPVGPARVRMLDSAVGTSGEIEMGDLGANSVTSDDVWGHARDYNASYREQSIGPQTAARRAPRVKSCCLVLIVVSVATVLILGLALVLEPRPEGQSLWTQEQADSLTLVPGYRWVLRVPSGQVLVVNISPRLFPGVTALEGWNPDRTHIQYRALFNHSDSTLWVTYTGGEVDGNCYHFPALPRGAWGMEWVSHRDVVWRESEGYKVLSAPEVVQPFAWQLDRRAVSHQCRIANEQQLVWLHRETLPRVGPARVNLSLAITTLQRQTQAAFGRASSNVVLPFVRGWLTNHSYDLREGAFLNHTQPGGAVSQNLELPLNQLKCQGLGDWPVLQKLCQRVNYCYNEASISTTLSRDQPQCRDSTLRVLCECTDGLAQALVEPAFNQCGFCNDTAIEGPCACWARTLLFSQAVAGLPCSNLTDRPPPRVTPYVFSSPQTRCQGVLRHQCVRVMRVTPVVMREYTLRCQIGVSTRVFLEEKV